MSSYAGQGYLLYQPSMPPGSREQVPTPGDYGMADWEEVDLTASDSTLLKAFVIYAPPDPDATSDGKRGHCSTRPTVLMLHANAGNVGHRMPLARVFVHRMRCNVVALSYRGYGKSQGKPSEKGILDDAQTTLDWTCSHDILGPTKKLLYGQSLGGAVSIGLAAGKGNAERLSGVILENTFLNIVRPPHRSRGSLAPVADARPAETSHPVGDAGPRPVPVPLPPDVVQRPQDSDATLLAPVPLPLRSKGRAHPARPLSRPVGAQPGDRQAMEGLPIRHTQCVTLLLCPGGENC